MVRASSVPVSISPGQPDDEVEASLDPAVERIRQRLKRLILVSSATLLVGFIAVLAAVIYKIGPVRDKPMLRASPDPVVVAGALPSGATVVSSSLNGTLLALTLQIGSDDEIQVLVLDLATGQIVRRLTLGTVATTR